MLKDILPLSVSSCHSAQKQYDYELLPLVPWL